MTSTESTTHSLNINTINTKNLKFEKDFDDLDFKSQLYQLSRNGELLKRVKSNNLTKKHVLAALEDGNDCVDYIAQFNDDEGVALKICRNNLKGCDEHKYVESAPWRALQTRVRRSFNVASARLLNNEEFVTALIRINPYEFKFCDFKDDMNVAAEAFAAWGGALEYASARIRNQPYLVLEACKNSLDALKYADAKLLACKPFIRELISNNSRCIPYLPKSSLKLLTVEDDLELILKIKNVSGLVKHLDNFMGSRVLAMHCASSENSAIKYFNAEIKDDEEVALKLVKENPHSFKYISKRLKADKTIAEIAISYANAKGRAMVINSMSGALRDDLKSMRQR